ncbi:MAG: flagellar protein FlaG [Flavobacteriales bacterium]|jgi:flagellar protein FlaG
MSVELTKSALDVFPASLHKVQGEDERTINGKTNSNPAVENKFLVIKATEESSQISKEKALEEKDSMTVPQLEKVAKQLQEFIGTMNRGLEFSVDKDSGRDVIKVIDKKSGELIKQYPSEEVLSLVSKLSEATGNFIDSKI